MREDGRRREKTRGGGGARNAIGAQPRETEATRRRLRATTESRASTSGVIHITSAVFTNRGGKYRVVHHSGAGTDPRTRARGARMR